MEKLRRGGTETGLREPPNEPEKGSVIKFDKYMSTGALRQEKAVEDQSKIIRRKTEKKRYEPDIPFQDTYK